VTFERKARAAGVAPWWVVVVGCVLLTLTWLVYLVLTSVRFSRTAIGHLLNLGAT
jgi:hypothetical protein